MKYKVIRIPNGKDLHSTPLYEENCSRLHISSDATSNYLPDCYAQHLYILDMVNKPKIGDTIVAIDGSVLKLLPVYEILPNDRIIVQSTNKSLGLPEISQSFIDEYVKSNGNIDKLFGYLKEIV